MNSIGHHWLLFLPTVVLVASLGCEKAATKALAPRNSVPNANESKGNSTRSRVEARIFTGTAGVLTLAMLAQSDVKPYVEAIILRPEVLNDAVTVVGDETITAEWLREHLRVQMPNAETAILCLQVDETDTTRVVSTVNAVAESFCRREPERVQKEIDRMMTAMKESLGATPNDKDKQMFATWETIFSSPKFQVMPNVIAEASVVDE